MTGPILKTHKYLDPLGLPSHPILLRDISPRIQISRDRDSSIRMSMYDEIEIEDMTYDQSLQIYHYPCPCGDRFEISLSDLKDGEDVAICPSCSLMIKVIFDLVCFSFITYTLSLC